MPDALRDLPERLIRSTPARIVFALILVAFGAFGAVSVNLAEDQAETTSGVVAEQCRTGQAAQVEAIEPGACGTAATVEDQGAGSVTVAGPSGTAGARGENGQAGENGQDGQTGAAGREGGVGPAGAPGRAGGDGAAGTNGRDGAPGLDGAPGAAGKDGLSVQGPQGETGARGPAGADGPRGPAGPSGEPGAPGRDGSPAETQTLVMPDGTTYACTRSGGADTSPTYSCSASSG